MDKKISQLGATTVPVNADLFAIVQSGVTKKITYQNLVAAIITETSLDLNQVLTNGNITGGQNIKISLNDLIESAVANKTQIDFGGAGDKFNVTTDGGVGNESFIDMNSTSATFGYDESKIYFDATKGYIEADNFGIGKTNPSAKFHVLQNTIGTSAKVFQFDIATLGELFSLDDNTYLNYTGLGATFKGSNGLIKIVSDGGSNPSLVFKMTNGAFTNGTFYGDNYNMFLQPNKYFGVGESYFNAMGSINVRGEDSTSTNFVGIFQDVLGADIFKIRNDKSSFFYGDVFFTTGTGIDVTATGGSDVLNIGGTNADVINIGHAGTTVNILGTALYEYAANQYVLDKLITLNYNGALASGAGVGFEIEENNVITGYFKTNASRNGFDILTPAIAYKSALGLSTLTADRTHGLPNIDGELISTGGLLANWDAGDFEIKFTDFKAKTSSGGSLVSSGGNDCFSFGIGGGATNTVFGALKLDYSTASRVMVTDASKNLIASSVTDTTLSYLDATSSIQTQLDYKVQTILKSVTDYSHTGDTNITKVHSALILANTFSVGDIIDVYAQYRKSGTAGNLSIRVYVNTTDDLTGATRIFQYDSGNAANVYYGIYRKFLIKSSTNTESIVSTSSTLNSITNSNTAVSSNNIDWTANQYLLFSLQLAAGADVGTLSGYVLKKE